MESTVPTDALPPEVERFIEEKPEEFEQFVEERFNGSGSMVLSYARGFIIAKRNRNRIAREAERARAQEQHDIERAHKKVAFLAGIKAASDYALATGGDFPGFDHLENLYKNGALDFPAAEVFMVSECETDEEFEALVKPFHEDRLAEEEAQRQALLAQIEAERQSGAVPEAIFRATVDYTERVSSGRKRPKRKFVDGEATNGEVIKRYIRFKIATMLTANFESPEKTTAQIEQIDPLRRRTGIALQFNQASNNRYSSLHTEIQKATDRPVEDIIDDIKAICEAEGWYDYMFPEDRKKHLDGILEKAEASP